MFRSSAFRLTTRRVPSLVHHGARRHYSQPYVATKTSDMPWLLGSVAVTIPAVAWLISAAPKPDASHDKQHHPGDQGKIEKKDKSDDKPEEKEDNEEKDENQDDSKEDKKEGERVDEDINTKTSGKDERTYEDTDSMQGFSGKPNVTEDTEHAEEKNVGQRHADDDKPRHKTDITKKGPPGMPKTQETVKK